MDDLDLTEQTPRTLDAEADADEDSVQPLTIPIPRLALEVAPLSPARAARGTSQGFAVVPPPVPARAKRWPTMQPVTAAAPRSMASPPPVPAHARRTPTAASGIRTVEPGLPVDARPATRILPQIVVAPASEPVAPAPVPRLSSTQPAAPPPRTSVDVDVRREDPASATGASTAYFDRVDPPAQRRNIAVAVGIAAVLAMVGLILGLGLRGKSGPTDAPVTPSARSATGPAAPAAGPAKPAVQPAASSPTDRPIPATLPDPATPPVPHAAIAAFPITSSPSGAIVTLIDDGNATVIGRTPVSASIDPTHTYDVVVALSGHATRIQHVDPSATHELAVDLTAPRPAPPTPQHPATQHRIAKAPAPSKTSTTPASGVLMLSSKPPCDITIDGKPTRLVTPQRAITLSAGTHSIKLTNAGQKINKTIAVTITSQHATQVAQDFTRH